MVDKGRGRYNFLFALAVLIITVVFFAIAFYIIQPVMYSPRFWGLCWGIGIGLFNTVLAYAGSVWSMNKSHKVFLGVVLGGFLIRLVFLGCVILFLKFYTSVDVIIALVNVAILYVILLFVEIFFIHFCFKVRRK